MTDHPSYNTAVENLQRYLRRLADNGEDREIFAVPIDGIYGQKTRNAIAEFQRLRSLPVTGVVDEATWNMLYREYEILIRTVDKISYPDFFPRVPRGYAAELGEESAFISVLQLMLDGLRVAYDSLPLVNITGKFDTDTVAAVKEFQRINALSPNGKVDRNTWNTLSEAYNRYAR